MLSYDICFWGIEMLGMNRMELAKRMYQGKGHITDLSLNISFYGML